MAEVSSYKRNGSGSNKKKRSKNKIGFLNQIHQQYTTCTLFVTMS